MSPLTARLLEARKRNDNVLSILRARLKNKSRIEKLFILQTSIVELTELPGTTVDTVLSKYITAPILVNYLKGIK